VDDAAALADCLRLRAREYIVKPCDYAGYCAQMQRIVQQWLTP
jgi:hypothetical protein